MIPRFHAQDLCISLWNFPIMDHRFRLFLGFTLATFGVVSPAQTAAPAPLAHGTELRIFSINDFHGHIQDRAPTPAMPRLPDAKTGEVKPQNAGGVAYLASVLEGLRRNGSPSLFVAAGDLMGASPQISSLLKDEPTLTALSELGLAATALGNHDLDAGLTELLRKTRGECPTQGCAWPEFAGARFPYLAANMVWAESGQRVLPSHTIVPVGALKVAVVGAVTRDTPRVIAPRAIAGLRFEDEADSLNALVPTLREQGAQVLVAVMHEGAMHDGAANDASYACPGLKGRVLDLAKRLDPAYAILISGHTHQAYTCKIDGRLLVQAGSFGAWLTESRLTLDAQGQVLEAKAVNHPVLQGAYAPNPAFAALVQRAAALTEAARNRPIAQLSMGAVRRAEPPFGDSALGNLVADAQLAYAQKRGVADVALTNSGGIRADLVVDGSRWITFSELFAIQPFGNDLLALTLSGAQLQELLRRQLPKRPGAASIQVSHNLRYTWNQPEGQSAQLLAVTVNGAPLEAHKDYRVIVNNFMADGGGDTGVLRQGRDRQVVGPDIDALVEWLAENPQALAQIAPGRIQRVDAAQ